MRTTLTPFERDGDSSPHRKSQDGPAYNTISRVPAAIRTHPIALFTVMVS